MKDHNLEIIEATGDEEPMPTINVISRKPHGFLGWVRRIILWLGPYAIGFVLGWAFAKFS